VLKQSGAKNLYYQQSYNAEDVQPVHKKAYYRIKAVTQNGKTSFSKIITVAEKREDDNNNLMLTATRNELTISGNSNSQEKITYRVVSLEGVVLQQGNVQLASNDAVRVSLSSVKAGLYIVSIHNKNLRQSQQIFVR
jgi:hypothetical protein